MPKISELTKIWKETIEPNSIQDGPYIIDVEARVGSKFLSVAMQQSNCCVWFTANKESSKAMIRLYCVGTGFGAVPKDGVFLGTVIDGGCVWHFFCQKEFSYVQNP